MLNPYRYRILLIIICVLTFCFILFLNREDEPRYLHQKKVPVSNVYLFKNLKGPGSKSGFIAPSPASWTSYHDNNLSALAILLTDTISDWIGLVHGLRNIGIPFSITTKPEEAILHSTVLVYPVISGKVLSQKHLRLLAAVPRTGGTLIGFNVLGGGLNEVFGFDTVISSGKRNTLLLSPPLAGITDILKTENQIVLANPADFPDVFPTNGYTNAPVPLFTYKNDTTAAMTFKDYGKGKAFAIGIDLGNYFLRYMNGRGFNAYRKYANQYDPGMDVWLRTIRQIYLQSSITSVVLSTVPFNKPLSLIITHDVDYSGSMENTVAYANMEKKMGIKATYFIQTKYIKDWNDDVFFNDKNVRYLSELERMGMEIASHSVSHSKRFSQMPLGTGKEHYPKYKPFVQDRTTVYNGSIMGELRVSKFLLEKFLKQTTVISFRPGHLENPFALPQALAAAGYRYSSAVTANNVQTHLPYMAMHNRGFESETGIVEIPITVEDELGVPLLQRLDSTLLIAEQLSSYGGVLNVLIHTNITGDKLAYEEKLLTKLKDKAWVGTLGEFGNWWSIRNKLAVHVFKSGNNLEILIDNPSAEVIKGIGVQLHKGFILLDNTTETYRDGDAVIVRNINPRSELSFRVRYNPVSNTVSGKKIPVPRGTKNLFVQREL